MLAVNDDMPVDRQLDHPGIVTSQLSLRTLSTDRLAVTIPDFKHRPTKKRVQRTIYTSANSSTHRSQFVSRKNAMLSPTLAKIEEWLATHRPQYCSLLNPPAHEYLFDALRSTAGVVLPDCIKRFYEWHDGQQAGTFDPLLHNLTFMTLMEIATTQQMHQHVSVFDQWSDEHWQPAWDPFLSNGGGDYLCIATESFRQIPVGSVLWYDHEISEREIVHKDFESFLEDLYKHMVTDQLELG